LLANDPLRRLRNDLDRELAPLRTPGAADKLREIFHTAPEEIARAANAAASHDEK
jgi:hypothetical protein